MRIFGIQMGISQLVLLKHAIETHFSKYRSGKWRLSLRNCERVVSRIKNQLSSGPPALPPEPNLFLRILSSSHELSIMTIFLTISNERDQCQLCFEVTLSLSHFISAKSWRFFFIICSLLTYYVLIIFEQCKITRMECLVELSDSINVIKRI